MPMPASMAASTAGPLAISTVQIAELTISSASASFTASVLADLDACADHQRLAVFQFGQHAV